MNPIFKVQNGFTNNTPALKVGPPRKKQNRNFEKSTLLLTGVNSEKKREKHLPVFGDQYMEKSGYKNPTVIGTCTLSDPSSKRHKIL